MTDPHEMFEAFIAEAIAGSPEPLQELGRFLADHLDENAWKTADRLLLQLAALQPSSAADAKPVAWRPWKAGSRPPMNGEWFAARAKADGYDVVRVVHYADPDDRLPIDHTGWAWPILPTDWLPLREYQPLYAQPHPSQQGGTEGFSGGDGWPSREEVARMIDPEAWALHDEMLARTDARPEGVAKYTAPSLTKADAILALFPPVVGWRPIETAPRGEPGLMIDVRSATTYRWLPYSGKSEQFRKGIKGRWQRATEYGWENAKLPTEGSEWFPTKTNRPAAPLTTDGVE